MKKLLLFFTFILSLYGIKIDFHSYEATFIQTVTDPKGKVIKYSGDVILSAPNNARWHYQEPIEKILYISELKVFLVEPELEQVIINRLEKHIDVFSILDKAKKIKDDRFETKFGDKIYTIVYKNSDIVSIEYKDELDNSVKILFSKQIKNKDYNINIFKPLIPNGYDVINN